jgi:hypothetical protein
LVGFGFDACILSDAADQPPLILTTQGTLPSATRRLKSQRKQEFTEAPSFVGLRRKKNLLNDSKWLGERERTGENFVFG